MFHEMFLILAPGSDPADRVIRKNEYSETELVPVPDVATAAAVVAATEGKVPVGLVGVEYEAPAKNVVVIFESPNADPDERFVFPHRDGKVTVVAAPSTAEAPAVARTFVAEGADRVELCGGMGVVPMVDVVAEVGDKAVVSPILYGFESLQGVASYQSRFEAATAG